MADRNKVLIHKGNKHKSQDILCPKNHIVAKKKGGKIEIKCHRCKHTVEV